MAFPFVPLPLFGPPTVSCSLSLSCVRPRLMLLECPSSPAHTSLSASITGFPRLMICTALSSCLVDRASDLIPSPEPNEALLGPTSDRLPYATVLERGRDGVEKEGRGEHDEEQLELKGLQSQQKKREVRQSLWNRVERVDEMMERTASRLPKQPR